MPPCCEDAMNYLLRYLKESKTHDQQLLLITMTLTCLGVVMVYSASAVMADKRYHDGFYFLKRQGGFAMVGTLLMLVTMQVDYHFWQRWALKILIFSLLLLLVVLIPGLGGSAGGSSRWIKIIAGFRFQPSELAKIALIFYLAFALDRKQEKIKSLGPGFLSYMVVLLLLMALLLKQPDLGSVVTLFLVAFIVLFAAGTRPAYIMTVILLSLPAFYLLVMRVAYRKRRIMAFLDPWQDPQNSGFQIIQSLMAMGTGGLLGQGLGAGKQKLFYLPEAHTDFILAVIGEELGFVGILVVVGLYFVLVERSLRIALGAPDPFGRFLALGIAVLLGVEATVNMGVVTGLLPTKGLALPLVSYGGSSLLITLSAIGILLNISSSGNRNARRLAQK
jgi:cell division protein FtsW